MFSAGDQRLLRAGVQGTNIKRGFTSTTIGNLTFNNIFGGGPICTAREHGELTIYARGLCKMESNLIPSLQDQE